MARVGCVCVARESKVMIKTALSARFSLRKVNACFVSLCLLYMYSLFQILEFDFPALWGEDFMPFLLFYVLFNLAFLLFLVVYCVVVFTL
jgi:hypothetical protein